MEEKIKEIVMKAKEKSLDERDVVMEVLHLIQEEFGYIPPDALEAAAKELSIQPSKLYETATFYTLFSMKKEAKHVIRVCSSLPCHVAGGREVVKVIKEELGIDFGEVTKDGVFKLEKTGCLGRCDTSPNMMIDTALYKNLTPEKTRAILRAYRKGVET